MHNTSAQNNTQACANIGLQYTYTHIAITIYIYQQTFTSTHSYMHKCIQSFKHSCKLLTRTFEI